MKLIFCPECYDVFKLVMAERSCSCGACSGKYVDNTHAEVKGPCVSLAIGNGSLDEAVWLMKSVEQDNTRRWYIDNTKIEYCWVRPNEGPGNPHTKWINEGDEK